MSPLKSILVVDDEAGIRSLLFDVLSSEGFKVSLAKNGVESLHQMRDRHFDLLITDIRMPGLNGIELLKKMKEDGRKERVIVMTGDPLDHSDLGKDLHPVFQLLQKPFQIHSFLDVVFSALARSSKQIGRRGTTGRKRAQKCFIN
ncbi:MAG: response regulator [Deltaproteobacteria bacterium]|nr:response regulator [Deltaproteobacteria bacterium]